MMRFCAVVVAAVLASSGGLVAHTDGGAGISQPTSECAYWISTAPTFQVCITADGTLDFLKSDGTQVLGAYSGLGSWEGHALCHADGEYQDIRLDAVIEDGWREPILVSRSSSKVVVQRTTTDNRFTLTQTWTRNVAQRTVTVVMSLKANIAARGVFFARAARPFMTAFPIATTTGDWSRYGYWIRQRILVDGSGVPWTALTATDAKFSNPYVWVGGLDVPGYCRAVHEFTVTDPPFEYLSLNPPGFIRYPLGNMSAGQKRTFTVTYRMQ